MKWVVIWMSVLIEMEVFAKFAEGCPYKEISLGLGVAEYLINWFLFFLTYYKYFNCLIY